LGTRLNTHFSPVRREEIRIRESGVLGAGDAHISPEGLPAPNSHLVHFQPPFSGDQHALRAPVRSGLDGNIPTLRRERRPRISFRAPRAGSRHRRVRHPREAWQRRGRSRAVKKYTGSASGDQRASSGSNLANLFLSFVTFARDKGDLKSGNRRAMTLAPRLSRSKKTARRREGDLRREITCSLDASDPSTEARVLVGDRESRLAGLCSRPSGARETAQEARSR